MTADSNFVHESKPKAILENKRQEVFGLFIWFRPFIQVNNYGVHESEIEGLIEDSHTAQTYDELAYIEHQVKGKMMDRVFGK